VRPLPWSHSSLESFVNCPRSFHATRVIKSVANEQGVEAQWGEWVHTQFQARQEHGVPLPDTLLVHDWFMDQIAARPGSLACERKIALNLNLKPVEFFAPDVWFRGVIDFRKIEDRLAFVLDYKTGKPHNKFRQLKLFALHTFHAFPEVELVNAQYYWTKTQTVTKQVYGREEISELWADVVPDLRQYREAFATDTWQARQSGLCKAHCPVLSCEFNGRSR
jgi:hypothetical protein